MNTKRETVEPKQQKKTYVKPVAIKHKAATLIVGSSSSQGCYYSSSMFGMTYYH